MTDVTRDYQRISKITKHLYAAGLLLVDLLEDGGAAPVAPLRAVANGLEIATDGLLALRAAMAAAA